jgi:hypothetical protein
MLCASTSTSSSWSFLLFCWAGVRRQRRLIEAASSRRQYHGQHARVYDIRALARALGGEVAGRDTVVAPGPGHSRKDRSLSVRLVNGGDFVVYSHAGDDWQQCKDYVRERLGWPAWQPGDGRDRRVTLSRVEDFDRTIIDAESEERRAWTEDELTRIARASAIWNEAVDPRGTLVEKYFAARSLVLPDDIAGTALRFHPACPWRDENSGRTIFIPALIAAFTSIDDDTLTAIHRIRLDQPEHWPKTQRRMLGALHRAAVKLDPPGNTLHVSEGVETGLAARQLGYAPAWALGSVGMISHFPLIDGVARLCVLGEAGTASAGAIKIARQRWRKAGRKAGFVMPEAGYSDLNDELMAKATA